MEFIRLKKYHRYVKNTIPLLMFTVGKKIILGDKKYPVKAFFSNHMTLQHEEYEPWLDAIYRAALITKDGAFIDVGVNTGQTLLKILSIDKNREYLGFEPQLSCCFYVEDFINNNDLKKHTLLPIGLSNRTGVMQLLSTNEDSCASMIEGFRPNDFYSDKKFIYVEKGDEIIPKVNLQQISIVKIDVEGGELEVIEGLKQTLNDYSPFVFFEVLNHFLIATGNKLDPKTIEFREARIRQIEHIFREIDYCIFNILPDNKLIEVVEIKPKVSSDQSITDYVAVHSNYKSAFIENFEGTLVVSE